LVNTISEKTNDRQGWIDVFRGLSIIAVLLIHILGRFIRQTAPGSRSWQFISVIHELATYAVPGFLLLSALLTTSSLLRKFDLRRYAASRLLTVLWPYLLWSGIFIFVVASTNHAAIHPRVVLTQILYGKAYFHLYFLWVLLQMLILLPLAIPLVCRKPPFWAAAIVGIALTAGFYLFNRYTLYDRWPDFTRSILHYIPVTVLGVWMGSRFSELETILKRGLALAAVLTASGIVLYLPLALASSRHIKVSSAASQTGEWLFTTAASFLVMALTVYFPMQAIPSKIAAYLGRSSLQIYLVHPLALLWLDGALGAHSGLRMTVAFLLYFSSALVLPLILAEVATRLRFSRLLFGR
jgi:surface polysaccharide O-acyltransferase-like enzyme